MYRVYTFFALILWFALVACQSQPTPTPAPPTFTPAASPTLPPLPTVTPTQPSVSIPIVAHLADEINPSEVSQEATLSWYFNQPMNEKSTLTPVRFTPPLAGTFTWSAEGMVLTFTPAGVLPAGKQITATLSRQLTTWDGQQMAHTATLEWVLQVKNQPLPLVKIVSRPSSTHRSAPFTMTFNYPLDEVSVLSAVNLTPAVEGSWRWEAITKQLTFTPSTVWPSATTFTVTFSASLVNVKGETVGLPSVVTIAPLTALTAVAPQSQTTSMPQAIIVTFDQPLSSVVLTDSLQIDPPLLGTLTVLGNQLVYTITGNIAYNTPYVVTLQPTITTAGGKLALTSVYSWSFTTPVFQSEASFGQGENWQIVDIEGDYTLYFSTVEPTLANLQFKLYHYPAADFISAFPQNNLSLGHGYGRPLATISSDKLQLAHSWSITPTTTYTATYQFQGDPALHVSHPFTGFPQQTTLPNPLPAGTYLLEMYSPQNPFPNQLLLIVSHTKLVVKNSFTNVWVWATDSQNRPQANLPITLYDELGQPITQGLTNEQGIHEFSLPLTMSDPALVTAGRGENITLLPVEPNYEREETRRNDYGARRKLIIQFYTDRFIYQPGDTLYYHAIVRQNKVGQIELPPAGLTTTVSFRDSEKDIQHIDEFGTVSGQIIIPADTSFRTALLVFSIYTPELEGEDITIFYIHKPAPLVSTLTITPSQTRPVVGQTITFTAQAHQAHSQPSVAAPLKLCLYPTSSFIFRDTPGTLPIYDPQEEKICFTGETNEQGQWLFPWVVPANNTHFTDRFVHPHIDFSRWTAELSWIRPQEPTITTYTGLSAYNAAELIQLEPEIMVVTANQPFTPTIYLLDLNSNPVPQRSLQLSISSTAAENQPPAVIFTQTILTHEPFTPLVIAEPGRYTLTLTGQDVWGNSLTAEQTIFVSAPSTSSWASWQITPLQATYQTGEIAQLVVETAHSGPALLTLERGQVREALLVQLTAPLTILDIPLSTNSAPNLYVTLSMWVKEETTLPAAYFESLNDFKLWESTVLLSVVNLDKQLEVTLVPDKTAYAPGEVATITIQVANQQGQPAPAALALTLTDEMSYILYPSQLYPLATEFHFNQPHAVKTWASYQTSRLLVTSGNICCHLDYPDQRFIYPTTFANTAVWLPNLRTDEKGQITVQITMPTTAGNWRLTGRAITQTTQVGETTVALSTQP